MMVPLANSDLSAEIDDEFADIVLSRSWRVMFDKRLGRHTYVYTSPPDGSKGAVMLHTFLFGKAPRGLVTDHIDGNALNNKRSNLRHCAPAENSWNSKVRRDSKSGMKGVMCESIGHTKKWRATVVCKGVKHRKYFANAEQANEWAKAKRKELHGAFSRHA